MRRTRFGRAADLLGLAAYLTIVYGRLPSPRVLRAALEAAEADLSAHGALPMLTLVLPTAGPLSKESDSTGVAA